MNVDWDAIIRQASRNLIEEIAFRENILKQYDFWDRKEFFISEKHKKKLKDSYVRSDAAARTLEQTLKAKDEYGDTIFSPIHRN